MKRFLKVLGWSLLAIVVVAIAVYAWAWWVAGNRYDKQWVAHDATFAIPFPLGEAEIAALKEERIAAGAPADDPLAGMDLEAVALARATEGGQHLVESRVSCNACHGADFGGGVIVDAAFVGRWVAPNLTTGKGSVTRDYTASDWDHAVRHGLRRGGRSSSMPATDFANLSDHELSDIVAYVRSRPPVDKDLGPVKLGPVFTFLLAFDSNGLSASVIDHEKAHAVEPPQSAPTAEFGEHIVQVCRGCHGKGLSGGKLQGDPNMPIVANITPHETGLNNWTEADFIRALREGKRKDGTAISEYMPWRAYGQMSDAELKAIWAYLRTVPPVEKGNR
ncbi:MAG: c-type cytochrome [Dongiaceae bacterium]